MANGNAISGAGQAAGGLLGGPVGIGIAFGANLLGGLFKRRSERRRAQKLRDALLADLQKQESILSTLQVGPSQSEGALLQTATTRTLSDLAGRGVLRSSIAAPAVAAAVAPIEEARQRRVQGLAERIAAARRAILEGTSVPGYGGALGESFEEGGDLLIQLAGRQRRQRDRQRRLGDVQDAEYEDVPGSELGDWSADPYRVG